MYVYDTTKENVSNTYFHYGLQSAKTNMNVEEVFFSIARDIKQRLAESDTRGSEVCTFPLLMTLYFCLPFGKIKKEVFICFCTK